MTAIIRVFDNGGKTWDRYTIVIDGDVYGMSETPRSPQGFNQYSGSIAECSAVLECLNGAEDENIGKEKELLDLPLEVRLAIGDRLRSE
jgi:hypothetical protein